MKARHYLGIVFLALSTFLLLPLLGGGGVSYAADKVIKWKCEVHWPAASVSYTDSAEVVIKKIKERTNGKLDIELFAAGALVPPKEIFNAVKRGMIEIGVSAVAYYRDQVPLAAVASGLPLNFLNVWECAYYHQWMGFEKMMRDACAKHGVYYSTDKVYPTELVSKKPIRSMADFKGLKIRSSGVLQQYLTSIGAAASYLPGGEVYAALASGVVDAAHWGAIQGADSMKFYDVCKFHLRPALNIAATDTWLVNQKALDKLPEDIKKVVLSTLDEHFWRRTNQYEYLEGISLPKIQKEYGVEVITLPPEEVAKMQKAAEPLWDKVAQQNPDCAKAVEMLRNFQKSLGH
jgi:TRAP-type mannitol/chloroaromatic compound transport system substrate-binding protein